MDTGNSHGLEAALPTDNREGQSDESRDLEEASPTDLALALDEAATAEVLNVQTFHDDGNSPTTILEENQKQTLALEEAARAEVLKVQTLLENDNTIHTDASVEVDVDDLCLDDLEMAQDKDYKKMQITFPSEGAKALSEIEDKAMAVLPVQAEHVRAEVRKMEKLFNNNNSTETSSRRRALGRAEARRNPTSHPGAFAVDGPGFDDDDDDGERTITVEASNQLEDITSQPLPNNADDDGLVEARPISESQQHLSQATPMRESEELHNSNMIRDKRAFVVLGGMLMLVHHNRGYSFGSGEQVIPHRLQQHHDR
ncbi:expressed unknown protein [Seminavis robusta]|uniref:Uncharacterized protein n=1 Tax=Seminavis robusta TaxID=568900 RepID=A0A9N8HCV5_9STRA|nr:expressed unknown protein [Seminavis robusta]|eukprot:Sro334_g119720.1 n/a (313) ;mRNA; r:19520-20568